MDEGTRDDCQWMHTVKGVTRLPEYGQSFVMMLTSCKGMSAVKYGLVSGGIGGRPEASRVTFPEPMSPF
jgi:hypothetical protein